MYDLSLIMKRAWELFRTTDIISFAECLHRAWQAAKAKPENEKRIADAKAAAGIDEEIATWKSWKDAGFEVIHGMKALFQVELIHAAKGDGQTYKASFFSASQVQPA